MNPSRHARALAGLLMLVLLACGCSGPSPSTTGPVPPGGSPAISTPAASPASPGTRVGQGESAGFTVTADLVEGRLAPGSPARLVFRVTEAGGQAAVRDFAVVHEKKFHLMLVRRDLTRFQHVHPELEADGSLDVEVTFPTPGRYRLFADFKASDGRAAVVPVDITVPGEEPAPAPVEADTSLDKRFGAFRVQLKVIKGQQDADHADVLPVTFAFTVKDASGKPAAVEPYLGAMGHLAVLPSDGSNLAHAHPLEMPGMDMGAGSPSPGGHPMPASPGPMEHHAGAGTPTPAQPGAPIEFEAHLPGPGLYRAWGQFQIAGKVHVFEFTTRI